MLTVISNHDDLHRMVEWHDITYHHVPVDSHDKAPAFAEVSRQMESYQTDLVVLAERIKMGVYVGLATVVFVIKPHKINERSLIIGRNRYWNKDKT